MVKINAKSFHRTKKYLKFDMPLQKIIVNRQKRWQDYFKCDICKAVIENKYESQEKNICQDCYFKIER